MPSIRRWAVVAAGTAVLAVLPYAVGHLPVGSSSISAATLLSRVQASGDVQYSGYAESSGGLAVPSTSEAGSVADLLGGHTQLRVWWRGSLDWRVDSIGAFGETDVHRDAAGTWTWQYERLTATRVVLAADQAVRLPEASDLLPPELGQRLLSEATAAEVSRLPVERIAGVAAPGLRLRPAQAQSSVSRVDVWVDPSTGVPLRVDVFGGGSSIPAVTTRFLDYSRRRPSAADTAFHPASDARVRSGDDLDLESATNAFSGATPPSALAGLARATRTVDLGAVGVYGRGVTELIATPLRGRFTDSLHTQLVAAGAVTVDLRTTLGVGPLNLLLLNAHDGGSWLLTGTVTAATLSTAADELATVPAEGQR